MTNEKLREYVTSVGFSLTLSETQIYTLVILHHAKGLDGLFKSGLIGPHTYGSRYFVTAFKSLEHKGLVHHPPEKKLSECGRLLTHAGHLVVQLLKDTGIYQDTLLKAGVAV